MFVHFKSILHLLVAAACLGLLSNCKKNRESPAPSPGNGHLSIELDTSYIGGALVDSALAIWETGDRQIRIPLEKNADTLSTDIDRFEAGTGTLTVTVFSRRKFGGFYLSRWVYRRQLTITKQNGLVIAGPKRFSDESWKPRVELKDGIGHFAVVALRPDDPYFFVKNVPGNLKNIILARDYWKLGGGVFRIGGGEWQCSTNCTNDQGHVENDQFFSFLPAQIGTSPWNHIEITVLYVQDEWGGGPAIGMTHSL